MIYAVIAVASLALAIYVRAQSPTVIRVDKDGDAAVLRGSRPIESWDILRVRECAVCRFLPKSFANVTGNLIYINAVCRHRQPYGRVLPHSQEGMP